MLTRRVFAMAATFALVAALVPLAGAAAAGPACTTTCYVNASTGNDTNGGASAGNAKKTIQAAVTQVSAGGTVRVAAGTYNESVSINKPLVLHGKQAGHDARSPRGAETIVTGSGGITYAAGATSGTIDGFTLDGYTGSTAEIVASNVGAGWTFQNNIIDVSNGGIYLNTDGQLTPPTSTITQNRFVQATPSWANSGDFGQAVLVWANTGNNITIANNSFVNLSGPGAAINTTQAGNCGSTIDPTKFGNDLAITGNSFVDNGAAFTDPNNGPGFIDENFLALFCTTSAQISNNTVTITDLNDANAVTPIYLGGGDWNTSVSGNTLTGNGASLAAGVNLNSDFYPSGTGVAITNNTISGFEYGIHVRKGGFGPPGGDVPSGFTISANTVTLSVADGIAIDQGTGGTVSTNTASGSGTYDCFDATSGAGTLGTANTWSGNQGTTSSPAGLCTPRQADLTISKHHRGDFQQIGIGVYTIVVSNVGNGPTTGTVTVHDRLPFGLFGYAIAGSGWTCTTATLTCTRSDALAAGASYPPITVNVAVAFSCGPHVVNVATVAGGGETNTSNDTARDPTNVRPFPIPF